MNDHGGRKFNFDLVEGDCVRRINKYGGRDLNYVQMREKSLETKPYQPFPKLNRYNSSLILGNVTPKSFPSQISMNKAIQNAQMATWAQIRMEQKYNKSSHEICI